MLIGYARTSTVEQVAGLEAQEAALVATGCTKLFAEQASSVGQRDQLATVLEWIYGESCNNPQTPHFPTPPDPVMLRARPTRLRSLTIRISASCRLSRTPGTQGDTQKCTSVTFFAAIC
ncbi:MAG TPA: recombinase family protein [Novosphingobium sp.]|nr:recombinase family protein [Novosphingobium sp.]